MDSSKRADGKEKEDGYKKLRTNLQESSYVASSGASTAPGGLSEAQEPHSILLNILPPEMIDLIADKLSVMDCLNAQKAFARDPKKAVANIRNGLEVNLGKQSALYLLLDTDEYDGKYQYNYKLESELPNVLLPTFEGLPISSESSKMITLPELEKGGSLGSIGSLKETFPNVVELKIVVRNFSSVLLLKLTEVVAAFSPQLTALQLLIFNDSLELTPWKGVHLQLLLSNLNECRFPGLRHFTLLFEDMEEMPSPEISPIGLKSLRLLSSKTLEECYLRLPAVFIDKQMEMLEANRQLQRVGLIACYSKEIASPFNADHMWGGCCNSLHIRSFRWNDSRWQIDLSRLEQFTSLRTLRISLKTDATYLTLMEKLSRLSGGRLTHLQMNLHYLPVSALSFCRPLSELAPCSPSVTHLKIVIGEVISHEIFSHLHTVRHFPNLQQLEVVFSRSFLCSDCEVYNRQVCLEMAMRPFRALDQLNISVRQ